MKKRENRRPKTEERKSVGICGWFIGNWTLVIGHCFAKRGFMSRLGHWKLVRKKTEDGRKKKSVLTCGICG